MTLVSFQFALFFLIVLPLNWLLRERGAAYKVFLLLSSYYFYGAMSLEFLAILIQFSFFTWLLGCGVARAASPGARRGFLILHLLIGLSGLAFFKYWDFFYQTMDLALVSMGLGNSLPQWEIIFPIGISFFTFQGLSYTMDVYRDPEAKAAGPLDVLLFVAFFPTVLNGPIMRAKNFLPQLKTGTLTKERYVEGYARIFSGLFKKLVLSSYLAEHIVQGVFEYPDMYSSAGVLAGAFGYSIQILCDFSGYSDLVIGVALLLGFRVSENFDKPYCSLDVREFWNRWHISFSTWLRDYLYISLGGNRKGQLRKHFNLMATMTLGGLWHGAGFNFIFWGVLHGAALIITHFVRDAYSGAKTSFGALALFGQGISWALTFCFVTFAWIFFGAESIERAWEIIGRIGAMTPEGDGPTMYVIGIIGFVLCYELSSLNFTQFYVDKIKKLPVVVHGIILAVLTTLLIRLGPDGVPQFIYFQF